VPPHATAVSASSVAEGNALKAVRNDCVKRKDRSGSQDIPIVERITPR